MSRPNGVGTPASSRRHRARLIAGRCLFVLAGLLLLAPLASPWVRDRAAFSAYCLTAAVSSYGRLGVGRWCELTRLRGAGEVQVTVGYIDDEDYMAGRMGGPGSHYDRYYLLLVDRPGQPRQTYAAMRVYCQSLGDTALRGNRPAPRAGSSVPGPDRLWIVDPTSAVVCALDLTTGAWWGSAEPRPESGDTAACWTPGSTLSVRERLKEWRGATFSPSDPTSATWRDRLPPWATKDGGVVLLDWWHAR